MIWTFNNLSKLQNLYIEDQAVCNAQGLARLAGSRRVEAAGTTRGTGL